MPLKTETLNIRYNKIIRAFEQVKSDAQSMAAKLASNTKGAEFVNFHVNLKRERVNLEALTAGAQSNGLVAYAKDEHNDPAYDIVSDYVAMRTALDAVITSLETTFPKHAGTGYLHREQWDTTNGGTTDRDLTPAETAGFLVTVNALVATFE